MSVEKSLSSNYRISITYRWTARFIDVDKCDLIDTIKKLTSARIKAKRLWIRPFPLVADNDIKIITNGKVLMSLEEIEEATAS